jgi:PAS domain S-box-containing protein
MLSYIEKWWSEILHIGYDERMNDSLKMRVFVLNAFLIISSFLTLVFVVVFVFLGSLNALQGLVILPLMAIMFYLNAKRKFRISRIIVTYGLMLTVLALALADRRTGTEYILIALGCCSAIVYERIDAIIASFFFAFACYVTYVCLDANLPFQPDPRTPYLLIQNSLMFLSGFAVMAQSLVFRRFLNDYSLSLRNANSEITHVNEELVSANEELKSANEELAALSEKLDILVTEKSNELQAYLNTINVNLYSATTDRNGLIINVNKPFVEVTGFSEEELIGQNFRILNSDFHPKEFFAELYNTIHDGKCWRGEIKNRNKYGNHFWVDMVIMPVIHANDEIAYFLCLALPITDRKNAEESQRRNMRVFEEIANETSHRVRGPMARIMGIMNLTDRNCINPEELTWLSSKLRENILELDNATSALTAIVNNHSSFDTANVE